MPVKFSDRRRAAFLSALAETGNACLAAERARVSRSWAWLLRRDDAKFDAACREALDRAKRRLLRSDEAHPPTDWSTHGGVELVVQKGNGRRVQVARARPNQWTAPVERRFLAALAATCNVRAAAAEAGMTASAAYNHRNRWPVFARNWEVAIEIGYARLEVALVESAIRFMEGEPDPDDAIVRTLSVAGAIQALTMNKFAVTGEGKPPGLRRRQG